MVLHKIETVCLAGQASHPWTILIDGKLDCNFLRCQTEDTAAAIARLEHPESVVHTTDSPLHYSNQTSTPL